MKNPTNEPEPNDEKEGGIPEWGQKLQQAVESLTEKLNSQPTPDNHPQPVPVPPEPKHVEPEPVIDLPEPEPEPQPEPQPENPVKKLLNWLF